MNSPMFLEAVMLLCFGLAWPLATLKMLRCGRVEGRGVGFTLIILSGYLVGSLSKLAAAEPGLPMPPVFWLYLLNTVSVASNAALQWHLQRRAEISRSAISAA